MPCFEAGGFVDDHVERKLRDLDPDLAVGEVNKEFDLRLRRLAGIGGMWVAIRIYLGKLFGWDDPDLSPGEIDGEREFRLEQCDPDLHFGYVDLSRDRKLREKYQLA